MLFSRRRRSRALSFEPLEGKALMAVSITENAGQLWITGDRRANNVQIYDIDGVYTEDESSYIEILADGQFYVTSTQISQINIDLGNGNDTLVYDLGDPTIVQTFFPERYVNASLGNGNDTVVTRVNGFTFDAAPDLVALGPGTWNLQFDLGNGNDSWTAALNADLLGLDSAESPIDSILALGVSGGRGNDRLDFSTTRPLHAELAQFYLTMSGGAGHDTLNARSGGEFTVEEASLVFERYGDAGNDRFYGILETNSYPESIVDIVLDTGTGNDLVNTVSRSRSRRRA
jgi:hypothetical protein